MIEIIYVCIDNYIRIYLCYLFVIIWVSAHQRPFIICNVCINNYLGYIFEIIEAAGARGHSLFAMDIFIIIWDIFEIIGAAVRPRPFIICKGYVNNYLKYI